MTDGRSAVGAWQTALAAFKPRNGKCNAEIEKKNKKLKKKQKQKNQLESFKSV